MLFAAHALGYTGAMLPRAPLLLVLLSLLAACGGHGAPALSAEDAFARLPEEIAGFRKARPDDSPGGTSRSLVARFANPNQAAAAVHAMVPSGRPDARDGEDGPEVGAAVEIFARASVIDAASRRENATLRHFGARMDEASLATRCLDVQLRGETPRRQLGCAAMLGRRVFVVTMVAPESVEPRRGARDPLLAVTLRLFGALSGRPPEPILTEALPVAAEEPIPYPAAMPPTPPRRTMPRNRAPAVGQTFRT